MILDLSHLSDVEHDIFVAGWIDAENGVPFTPYRHSLWKLGHLFFTVNHAS
jgi:hypothetical protein